MNIELDNHLVQSQKIIITQKLVENLEILQMPSLELEKYISESVTDNPLLECDTSEILLESLLDSKGEHNSEKGLPSSEDYTDTDDFLACTKTTGTLKDYLLLQLLELKVNTRQRKIAYFLIENVDQDGYLREDSKELARVLKCPFRLVDNCLRILQTFEPAGVFARSLKECLLLQLRRMSVLDENVLHILDHHFDDLASKSFAKIARASDMEIEEVENIYSLIKSLNPKPGEAFLKSEWSPYVIPDLYLSRIDGKYICLFNDTSIPSLRINGNYLKSLEAQNPDRELRDYLKARLSRAKALLKAIDNRKRTLLDIAGYIAALQEDFFEKGPEYLKPVTMQMAADMLGVSVSTISRAVSGKYVQTPRGLFELKFFFSNTLEVKNDEKMSSSGVKDMIRRIIQSEDKRCPLSDQQLKSRLDDMGVNIARRTIAKYREGLSILPAAMRKAL